MRKLLLCTTAALALAGFVASARVANAGLLYVNDPVTIYNYDALGVQGNAVAKPTAPHGGADYIGTYTGPINFSVPDCCQTTSPISAFTGSSGGTFTAPISNAVLNLDLSHSGFTTTTLFDFTFTLTSAADGFIYHDDGFSIYDASNTLVVDKSTPVSPTLDYFATLAPGTYHLWYSAANGDPEVLNMNVPEPATLGLLGAGLVGAALVKRRARKAAKAA